MLCHTQRAELMIHRFTQTDGRPAAIDPEAVADIEPHDTADATIVSLHSGKVYVLGDPFEDVHETLIQPPADADDVAIGETLS